MDSSDRVATVTLTRRQKAIAAAMTAAWAVPQFSIEMTLDAGALHGPDADPARRTAGTVVDYLIAASAAALRDHPEVNSAWHDGALVRHEQIHVGVAVDIDGEVLNPAVRDADRRTVTGIMAERRRLTTAARSGRLTAAESYGATFTISNLGPFGVRRFNSLVVPPQVASLAVGAPDPSGVLNLNLSCDHRVLNGAPAARFLTTVVTRAADLMAAGQAGEPDR